MACGDYGAGLLGAVSQAKPQDFVTCSYINTVGQWIWPLMVVGALMAGTFAATRSVVPPIILMLLLGPFMIATLPGAGANILVVGALFVIPAVLFLAFLRFKQARP